jgi:hypothetical protein
MVKSIAITLDLACESACHEIAKEHRGAGRHILNQSDEIWLVCSDAVGDDLMTRTAALLDIPYEKPHRLW